MKIKYKIASIILVILLVLTVTVGLSYAYYVAFVSNDSNNVKTNITSENLIDIELAGDNNITSSNLIPGESVSTTFIIDNQNNVRVCLSLLWSDVINTFINKNDLVVSLKDSTGTEWISLEDKQIFPSGNETLLATLSLRPVHKETYTLTVTYQETMEDQSSDMGKSFKGTIIGELKECPTSAVEYITELAKSNDSLVYDETSDNNLRYIGSNPNNYVSIDGELWRIIGVMNNIKTSESDAVGESRVKLLRNDSLGNYSWDTSGSSVNNGYGINEWSQAKLMKLLNPGYESESIGGSLYWNNSSGKCYYATNLAIKNCDFTSNGIKKTLKTLIDNVVWNTGANLWDTNGNISSKFYAEEHGKRNGVECTDTDVCNDTVARTTTWTGKVGLMYPSDYGYATAGGEVLSRNQCLNLSLHNWYVTYSEDTTSCYEHDWIYGNYTSATWQWTLTSRPYFKDAWRIFSVYNDGRITNHYASLAGRVRPAVYLLSSVRIISGTGSSTNPFVLSL